MECKTPGPVLKSVGGRDTLWGHFQRHHSMWARATICGPHLTQCDCKWKKSNPNRKWGWLLLFCKIYLPLHNILTLEDGLSYLCKVCWPSHPPLPLSHPSLFSHQPKIMRNINVLFFNSNNDIIYLFFLFLLLKFLFLSLWQFPLEATVFLCWLNMRSVFIDNFRYQDHIPVDSSTKTNKGSNKIMKCWLKCKFWYP